MTAVVHKTDSGRQQWVSAVVEPDLKRALVERAARNERTASAELRLALRRHLATDQERMER